MTDARNKCEQDLKRLFQGAHLSALPQSAIQILELSKDPNNGPAEFAAPIEGDPGLAGQVLRFVNSSYFGFSREISSVKLAITLVGVRTIKNFTLWSAVFSLMPNPQCGPFELKSLWLDSLRRGLFARKVANLMGMKDAEEPFMAALLQDMAVPLLAKEYPTEYADMLQARQEGAKRLSDLEREKFGWTHAEAGQLLADHWHLPDVLGDMLRRHTDWSDIDSKKPAIAAVALSSLLPVCVDSTWTECAEFERRYQTAVGDKALPVAELLAHIDTQFEDFAAVFKMSAPKKSLAEYYADVATAAG